MSRLLFSFMGGHGHFAPLVPIARAAQSAGHTVAFACGPALVGAVEAAGFSAYPLGAATGGAPERSPLRQLDPAREDDEFRERFAGAAPRRKVPLLIAFCAEWRPDVILCDEADFGSLLAAERLALPRVTVNVMAAGSFVRADLLSDTLNAVRVALGLEPDPTLAMLQCDLVLSPFPPAFRDPRYPLPPTAFSYNPQASARATAPPVWAGMRPGAPLVYFSLGTVFNLESGDLFNRALAGLQALPMNLIVTVGHEIDPLEFGPQPEHVRIERYVPQNDLLPHCSLIVTHGGSGSVAGALTHGVPLLILPMGADQPHNAWRCETLGLGRWLDPVAATPADVLATATSLITDPAYRAALERIRLDVVALPGPDAALERVEALLR